MLIPLLTSMMLMFTALMFLAPSPLPLGAMILLLALSAALTISNISSSWFSLMMFLIYIGGLLVMFIYFAALAPNKLMSLNHTLFTLSMTALPTLTLWLLYYPSFTPHAVNHMPLLHLTTLYTPTNIPVLLFMALVLFLILVAVVKISTQSSGPLRPFK